MHASNLHVVRSFKNRFDGLAKADGGRTFDVHVQIVKSQRSEYIFPHDLDGMKITLFNCVDHVTHADFIYEGGKTKTKKFEKKNMFVTTMKTKRFSMYCCVCAAKNCVSRRVSFNVELTRKQY